MKSKEKDKFYGVDTDIVPQPDYQKNNFDNIKRIAKEILAASIANNQNEIIINAIKKKYPSLEIGNFSKPDQEIEVNMPGEYFQFFINAKKKLLNVWDYDGNEVVVNKKWNTISDLLKMMKKYANKAERMTEW